MGGGVLPDPGCPGWVLACHLPPSDLGQVTSPPWASVLSCNTSAMPPTPTPASQGWREGRLHSSTQEAFGLRWASGRDFLLCERMAGVLSPPFPGMDTWVIIPEGCPGHPVASTPRGSFSAWPTAARLRLPRRSWPSPPPTSTWCTWASPTTSSTRPRSCTSRPGP